MELTKCVLTRDNNHMYSLFGKEGNPQYRLNNGYGFNQLYFHAPSINDQRHRAPEFDEIVTFACINYLLTILGIKPTAISSSTNGFIATYYDSQGKLFGTYNISKDSKSFDDVCRKISRTFYKRLIGTIETSIRTSGERAKKMSEVYFKILSILRGTEYNILGKCLEISKIMHDNNIPLDFADFNKIDSNNCSENHKIISKILCGKDEKLASALEQYISVKEKTDSRFVDSRTRDLIAQSGDYILLPDGRLIPTNIPPKLQIKFIIVSDIFDKIYDKIISLYYRNSGEPIMVNPKNPEIRITKSEQASEEACARSYDSASDSDAIKNLESELKPIVEDGLKELMDLRILPSSIDVRYIERAVVAIINICTMDFSLPLVSRVITAIDKCKTPNSFDLSVFGFDKPCKILACYKKI